MYNKLRNITQGNILPLFLVVFIMSACNRTSDRLEYALKFAENNRVELEKVLEHYKSDGNPKKLEAAVFLIENIPFKYSYKGWQIDSLKKYKVLSIKDRLIVDEVDESLKHFNFTTLTKVYDAKVITSDYLINNIEFSFKVWNETSWGKHYSFDEFCEYILPYRLGDEPIEEWKPLYYAKYKSVLDSLGETQNVIKATQGIANYLKIEKFTDRKDFNLPHLGAQFLYYNRVGYCRDNCDFAAYVMRSLGIPVGVDKYLKSPCYRSRHFWNALIDTTHTPHAFNFMEFNVGPISNMKRKCGKIYRHMYGVQPEKVKGLYTNSNFPNELRNPFIKDVTSTYFNNRIEVQVNSICDEEYVYLSVFSSGDWHPIDIGQIRKKNVSFCGVENNLIYNLIAINNGIKYTVGDPFVLKNNIIHYLKANNDLKVDVELTRKYPMMWRLQEYLESVNGVKIYGNNKRTLEGATNLCIIQNSKNSNIVSVDCNALLKHRYIFYTAPTDERIQLAEIHFYSNKEGELELFPKINGYKALSESLQSIIKCSRDNDLVSFYLSKTNGETLVFDFDKPVSIDRIEIAPRNDDNFIHKGDVYELFYHDSDKGWVSLGKQKGEGAILKYKNVPDNALMWLRNLTRGREEEVFYYENGKQVFAYDI
jgi:hypothetical protein